MIYYCDMCRKEVQPSSPGVYIGPSKPPMYDPIILCRECKGKAEQRRKSKEIKHGN